MEFSTEAQFWGFVSTPQIFAEKDLWEYPLYPTYSLSHDTGFLKNISEPTSNVLGKRMEDLFAAYVTQFTSEEILLQNRQIIKNKETLGEIDFLLKNTESEEISHVELIYKFYLYDPDTGTTEKDHLIGPNRRDSLNRKLQRLHKRQFPLLFNPATRELLNTINISAEEVVQKMCFKALIFLPKEMEKDHFSLINPQSVVGYWIKVSQFTREVYGTGEFYTPKKRFWPVLPRENQEWYSFEEILEQIQPLLENKYAPLIWMKTANENFERFFLVWW